MKQYVPIGDVAVLTLFALYELVSEKDTFDADARELASEVGFGVSPGAVGLALEQLANQQWVRNFGEGATVRSRLSPEGAQEVERMLQEPDALIRQYRAGGPEFSASRSIGVDLVPASDRIVPLNHNSPEYQNVADRLEATRTAIAEINIETGQESARDDLLASLDAASALWKSTQLTLLQIKVGVLLAAEKAQEFAADTAQKLKVSLLVEAIKAFLTCALRADFNA